MVELTDKSTDEKKANPFIFELLYQTLNYINEGYDPEILKNIYEMKMLMFLVFILILNQCAVLWKSRRAVFFFDSGRWNHLSSLLDERSLSS